MKTLLNILFTTLFVVLLAHLMPGVYVHNLYSAVIVALVLGLLNIFVKPILVLFTLPATIFTLGLFLLVINAIIVMICDYLIDGFAIIDFFHTFVFSLILSLCQSLVSGITKDK
ncbi:phage holin family protein [Flavobacterium sp. Sd200]|uniref:phage holin family protein n=1 Tax=Flavobacterium sp. Sd200 TaxID=2692211 RepID=UPI0013707656|nr:phage holin family protein [Flavobacterium sp. Sd200]MXN92048.1 phage holin family protein [Flavobacterium sp. Sd200]